jgi:hypothetical protein
MSTNAEHQKAWRIRRNQLVLSLSKLQIELEEVRSKMQEYKTMLEILREEDEEVYQNLKDEAKRRLK